MREREHETDVFVYLCVQVIALLATRTARALYRETNMSVYTCVCGLVGGVRAAEFTEKRW